MKFLKSLNLKASYTLSQWHQEHHRQMQSGVKHSHSAFAGLFMIWTSFVRNMPKCQWVILESYCVWEILPCFFDLSYNCNPDLFLSVHRRRGAAVSSVTAGSTPAVWCVVAGPPPGRTLSMSCPPWSACQDWILASTPFSPSPMVSVTQPASEFTVISYFT